MPNSRIIDEGIYNGEVSPNKKLVYLIACAMGLLLPAAIILLRMLLNNKVESREEVISATPLAIAGEIGLAPKKSKSLIVSTNSQTPIAEQFRSLRTNLFYSDEGNGAKTILVTSFMRGEGKGFISANLANTIAISGKKVILLDFDLRKGRLSERLGCEDLLGISNFLTSDLSPDEVIQPVHNIDTLYFIPSGHLPANPGELILSSRMHLLLDCLKQNFDYIVIDSAPVGVVSDAITLGKWADITLFVMRHNYSFRSTTRLVNELNDNNKLPNLKLVINGIQPSKGYTFGGYGYGYGYDYKSTNRKRTLLK